MRAAAESGVTTIRFAVVAAIALAASPAAAEPTELGAWFGPRLFNGDSLLGFIDDAPHHPTLENAIEFGVRVARPFFPWLVPELELAMSPTHTTMNGAAPADVFWLEPRLHLRLQLPGHRVTPFLLVGGGSTIAVSSARKTFDSDILGVGYIGAGVRFDTTKGFVLRFDARLEFVPGNVHAVTEEGEFGFGLEFPIGGAQKKAAVVINTPPPDRDGDGIPDAVDQCPDRAEDFDGFEDADGCPDIDNDRDGILDQFDRCPNVPETYNGFEDEDGCPDTVPPDVESLKGSIEGLIYADGETAVHDSAIPNIQKIATVMKAHANIKVVLIGYTDDREAAQFGQGDKPDIPTLSADLSRARSTAVKAALVEAGISAGRITVEGYGAEDPVSDNDTPKHRLANRRVEIKLFVPQRR